ncbi:OLC1v1018091C1 [Oldenlandia corymbosa var. corymbosa]|uniref:OLC1v1018091C1 n=1 Tax=Oldenlandia corymbosa var. corymbosa TaxID=529605 RepID=A0AAV1EAV8_OLDCO|nr:OLC1v1018091C1 [Oldenlandia corymbosa var. corymbosa]
MALPQILPSTSSSAIPNNKSHLNPTNHHSNNPVKPFFLSQPPIHRRQWRRKPMSLRCSASSFSEKHHTNQPKLSDDRFFLICKGQERFRVTKLVRTKPYLVAEVVWLEDRPSANGDEDLNALADEVETYMKDVIRLSNRLNGKPEKEVQDLRRNLFPTPFSFFVGSTFEGAPREQQALLELEDTAMRLKREKETLRNTLNYLTAASAVKDVFPST